LWDVMSHWACSCLAFWKIILPQNLQGQKDKEMKAFFSVSVSNVCKTNSGKGTFINYVT
jgi:hypothetical protein